MSIDFATQPCCDMSALLTLFIVATDYITVVVDN